MSVIDELLAAKWQPIEPFERNAKNKTIADDLKDGESEYDVCENHVHIVEWDGEPPMYIQLTDEELAEFKSAPLEFKKKDKDRYRAKCFLWVIESNCLKIAREAIPNEKRTDDSGFICHTNLTSAGAAYIGGEILFDKNHIGYVNFFSDRYGGENTPTELWEAAKNVFRGLGYETIIDFFEI